MVALHIIQLILYSVVLFKKGVHAIDTEGNLDIPRGQCL